MRLGLTTLIGAVLLAGCEPEAPGPGPSATQAPSTGSGSAAAVVVPEDPGQEAAWKELNARTADSPQARGQAEAAMRDLDARASTLDTEIAGVRDGAEAARRAAAPVEPAAPPSATVPEPKPEPAATSATPPAAPVVPSVAPAPAG